MDVGLIIKLSSVIQGKRESCKYQARFLKDVIIAVQGKVKIIVKENNFF